MPNEELLSYQINKNSIELVQKHRKLISKLARLAHGSDTKKDSQYKWFYGLFLEGHPKTKKTLQTIQKHSI